MVKQHQILLALYEMAVVVFFIGAYLWLAGASGSDVPAFIAWMSLPGSVLGVIWPGIHSDSFLVAMTIYNLFLFCTLPLVIAVIFRQKRP